VPAEQQEAASSSSSGARGAGGGCRRTSIDAAAGVSKKQRVGSTQHGVSGAAAAAMAGGQGRTEDSDAGTPMGVEDDIDMQGGHGDTAVLSVLSAVKAKLQRQLARVEEAEAKAQHLFAVRDALPPPQTDAQQNRVQDVDQHLRVLQSMVRLETQPQLQETEAERRMEVLRVQMASKVAMIEGKMANVGRDEQVEYSLLENVPEVLWMSDERRIGIGCFLGFIPSIESILRVSTHFRSLTEQPAMHPIVQLNRSPKPSIAARWTGRLSMCHTLVVDRGPTASLLQVLEATAPTVQTIDLRGQWQAPRRLLAPPPMRRKATSEAVGGNKMADKMPVVPEERKKEVEKKKPIVFPHLRKVSVRGDSWGIEPDLRNYQFPALSHLTMSSTSAPLKWIGRASVGLTSIHIVGEEQRVETMDLNEVASSLISTPTQSAATLTSLTGLLTPRPDRLPRFIRALNGSRLQKIELMLRNENELSCIEALHHFRTRCLAPTAEETYYSIDPLRLIPTIPRNDKRLCLCLPLASETVLGPQETRSGVRSRLTACLSTAQVLCAQADAVVLRPQGRGLMDDATLPAGALACSTAKELYVEDRLPPQVRFPRPGIDTERLPASIVSDPASFFPSVESVVVHERQTGEALYGRGVGKVLGALPALETATFEAVADVTPNGTLCVVPPGAAFLAPEGKPLTLHSSLVLRVRSGDGLDIAQWRLYGDGDKGREVREVMEKRVRQLHVTFIGAPTIPHIATFCTSMLESMATALDSCPLLQRVTFVMEFFSSSTQVYTHLREQGEGAGQRFSISVTAATVTTANDKVTVTMSRPSGVSA